MSHYTTYPTLIIRYLPTIGVHCSMTIDRWRVVFQVLIGTLLRIEYLKISNLIPSSADCNEQLDN